MIEQTIAVLIAMGLLVLGLVAYLRFISEVLYDQAQQINKQTQDFLARIRSDINSPRQIAEAGIVPTYGETGSRFRQDRGY